MNFILMRFDYPPAVIKSEDKANYFAVLQQADAGAFRAVFGLHCVEREPFVGLDDCGGAGGSVDEDEASAAFDAMRQRVNDGHS